METMKKFQCGDVVPGCEASWVCSTEEEILARVAEHAAASHGIQQVSPELVAAVRQRITTA
jgi:predicted small metal-binding protein